jgi:hypothetical protein
MTRPNYALPGSWAEKAACRTNPRLMWLPEYRWYQADWARIHQARLVCNGCPVVDQCRTWGLTSPDPAEGMMAGGYTQPERDNIRRGLPVAIHTPGRRRIHRRKAS